MSPTADDISMSCLCCRFLNNKNLFLPTPLSLSLSQPSTNAANGNVEELNIDNNNDNNNASIVSTVGNYEHVDGATAGTITTIVGDDSESNVCDPFVAWQRIQRMTTTNKIWLVDTHTHAHLEREDVATNKYSSHVYSYSRIPKELECDNDTDRCMAIMSCAVDIDDWERCLEYAAKSKYRIPALGIHPWYIESVLTTTSDNGNAQHDIEIKNNTTTTTTWWLNKMEGLLQLHPGCMVGEIGLCKVARFLRTYSGGKQAALKIQRDVFVQQLFLAAKYHRPVSIHCVNQHGVLLEVFQSLLHSDGDDNGDLIHQIPPAMALHSYTGTAHHVQHLLQWEQQVHACQTSSSTTDPLLYFGFSHSVNYIMCTSTNAKRQGMEKLRSIPRYRILIESDVHCTDHVVLGASGTIAFIAHALHESVEDVAALTTQNGLRFFSSIRCGGTKLVESNV